MIRTRALSLALGAFCALAVLLTGLVGLLLPGYGGAFLDLVASFSPGYHRTGGLVDLLVGTAYAFLEGAVAGLIFANLFNRQVVKHEAGYKSFWALEKHEVPSFWGDHNSHHRQ